MNVKITVVGGGSTYTPELVDGFARLRDVLVVDELWLVDPDAARLGPVAAVSERMWRRAGCPGRIRHTADLVEGVDGADIVLIQLRVGGQRARHTDEIFPHAAGCIGQETTGPGGLAKALRTVPVVLGIADVVRRHAKPDAWIIDFTNPVGIVTRALRRAGHRAVGLCNVAIGFQRRFAKMLDVAPKAVSLQHVGLNHLTWERGITVTDADGARDLLPELIGAHLQEVVDDVRMPGDLITLQQAVPSYYLRYYYEHDIVLGEQQQQGPTRAEKVLDIEQALLEKYNDPTVDTKPEELSERGGAFYSDAAIELIATLTSGSDRALVLNVDNNGTLPFLPDDHVIEVPARVTGGSAVADAVAPLPAEMAGLIGHVAEYERLALDAALHGGRDRVLRTLLAHPLVGQFRRAEILTDRLLAENAQFLEWAK